MNTNTTFLTTDTPKTVRDVLDFLNDELKVDHMMISPACYLMADGYTQTYQELIETTDWSKYGRGNDPRCDNCMAHCGYEPTAVLAASKSLKQSVRALVAHR